MRRAVAISSTQGEAVHACGATLAGLAAGGWEVVLLSAAPSDADHAAAAVLGLTEVDVLRIERLPFEDDEAATARVAALLGPLLDARHPERVFAPLTGDPALLGALSWLGHPAPVVRFRSMFTPPTPRLGDEHGIPIAAHLDVKARACAAYGTSEETVREHAAAEGRRLGVDGPAEALVEPPMTKHRLREQKAQAEREERAALAKLRATIARS